MSQANRVIGAKKKFGLWPIADSSLGHGPLRPTSVGKDPDEIGIVWAKNDEQKIASSFGESIGLNHLGEVEMVNSPFGQEQIKVFPSMMWRSFV